MEQIVSVTKDTQYWRIKECLIRIRVVKFNNGKKYNTV